MFHNPGDDNRHSETRMLIAMHAMSAFLTLGMASEHAAKAAIAAADALMLELAVDQDPEDQEENVSGTE